MKSSREKELDELREKGVTTSRRDKLKDHKFKLNTPEEVEAYLASLRKKESKSKMAPPPTNLSMAEMNSWYTQQRQVEKDIRKKREEAEAMLRGYRMSHTQLSTTSSKRNSFSTWGATREIVEADAKSKVYTAISPKSSLSSIVSPSNQSQDGASPKTTKKPADTEAAKEKNENEDEEVVDENGSDDVEGDMATTTEEEGAEETDTTAETKDEVEGDDAPEAKEEGATEADEAAEPKTETLEESKEKEVEVEEKDGDEAKEKVDSEEEAKNDAEETEVKEEENKEEKKELLVEPDTVPHPLSSPVDEDEEQWQGFVSREEGARFPPEAGRYHLYASYACPWAHRTLIVRALKGLEDVISVSLVHPIWRRTEPENDEDQHRGWVFGQPDGENFCNTEGLGGPFPAAYPGNDPDPVFGCYSVRELYDNVGDTVGKYTIPILFDKKTNTIVNNESSDIMEMLNSEFNEFATKNKDLDLFPEEPLAQDVGHWMSLNNSVYKAGFATNQQAYDAAMDEMTSAFDNVAKVLDIQRYLSGSEKVSEVDIRLFVTLLRFDEVYAFYFKSNSRLVLLTPILLNFCRDIYQMDGVAETCNMEHIKAHFFCSHSELNRFSIVPRGLGFIEQLKEPHDREKFGDLAEF